MLSKAVIVGIFIIDMDSGAEHFVAVDVVVYVFKPDVTFTFTYIVQVIYEKSPACSLHV